MVSGDVGGINFTSLSRHLATQCIDWVLYARIGADFIIANELNQPITYSIDKVTTYIKDAQYHDYGSHLFFLKKKAD